MQQVLRYFHQDPNKSVQSSSTQLIITLINLSINNNTRALEDKQNTIPGKSLSSNDFTDYYKNKLKGIEEEAEVNVQADWDENDSTADSYIQNKPGIDTVITEDSNNLITSGAVFDAIDELPEPMIFKGSLGIGGTIQVLPTADNTNVGYTYKVITAGTYDGKTAKPGDTYISDGTEWILIPSGDEPNGTVTNVAMTVPTGLEVSGSPITTSGTLAITYAVGYAIPTLTDQAAWTAKQDAISDLATIRSNANNGNTAYSWGNHADAGYVKSSGVTSVAMTVPTGLSISGSPITSAGTLALSLANGYSIPTTAKLSNWDTAYGWGDHASAGYLKSITKAMVTSALGYTPPAQDTNNYGVDVSLVIKSSTYYPVFYSNTQGTNVGLKSSSSIEYHETNYESALILGDNLFGISGVLGLHNGDGGTTSIISGSGSYGAIITVPNNSGTLALTSQLNNYLPLSGGTMTGDINLSTNTKAIVLNTDTSWSNSDRSIPFGVNGDDSRISWYYTDSNKGLTYNPSTGSLKAASFVKRGGTSSLFLKADGSVDSNGYLPLSGGTISGNISLYSSSGDSPYLYFQRGTASDTYNDWRIYVPGGNLDFCMSSNGAWNTNPMLRLSTSPGTAYLNGNLIYTSANVTVTNVTQNLSGASNTDFRPILASGVTNASSVTPTFSSGTGSVMSVARLYVKPSTGDLYLYNPDGGESPYLYFQRGDFNTSNTYDWRINVQNGDFFFLNDANGWHSALSIDYNSNIHLQGIIITPADDGKGIEPATNNYGQVGSSSKYFYRSYINNMYGTVKGSFDGGNVTGNDASFYNYRCRNNAGFLIDSYGTLYFNSDGGSGDFNIYNNKNNNLVRAFYINSNNNATLAGTLTLNSDIRLKRIVEDCNIDVESIANAPLFKFRWKNRDDDNEYIGTSALYWLEVIPLLVQKSDDDFKTLSLQYGTLGVVNSITIAKEVVSLKEEIKLLQALIAELKLLLNN